MIDFGASGILVIHFILAGIIEIGLLYVRLKNEGQHYRSTPITVPSMRTAASLVTRVSAISVR